jgi:DNA-directed RNA polymerase subunit RPC12/RpoP
MEVLASKFEPVVAETGGVVHVPKGYTTIDLNEMRGRFKAFGLQWPSGDIDSLQKLRNTQEHFHSDASRTTMREAIANGFPIVSGFFAILGEDPANELGKAWETMLQEEAFFAAQKAECDATLNALSWSGKLQNSAAYRCAECGSSLLGQLDPENGEAAAVEGQCKACGTIYGAEEFVALIAAAEHDVDEYLATKNGFEPVLYTCPDCSVASYVLRGDGAFCYFCNEEKGQECGRCGEFFTVANESPDYSDLCDYCGHITERMMAD